jgi:hypothetical protein
MSGRTVAPRLALATIACLFVSTLVPIWASVTPGKPPAGSAVIDGILVVLLVGLLAVLHVRNRAAITPEDRASSFEVCRWVASVPLLLFVLYALGVRLKWDVLLIGLGWRTWYLVTVLPFLVTVRRRGLRPADRQPLQVGRNRAPH